MSNLIHPTALVEDGVELDGVSVGPFCVVRRGVKIGKGSVLHSHCVIEGDTHLGVDNMVFPFASIGLQPQDLKYKGEPTRVRIGDRNHFREACTVHRGTASGHQETKIGSDNLIMAYAHVAHDCQVGSHVVLANSVALAGHVTIEDYVTLGGMAAVHQFCRVGQRAFLSAGTLIGMDVPPFCIADGRRAGLAGLNVVGLKRAGFDLARVQATKRMYREFYLPGRTREEALTVIDAIGSEESKTFAAFVRTSQRGVLRPRREIEDDDGVEISLIAGNGNFPRMFIAQAKARGVAVSAVGFRGETEPVVEKLAQTFRWIELGKLQPLIDALKNYPARQVALAGGIKKTRFFLPIIPDARALRVLKSVVEKKDDGLLRALARELESEGLSVVASTIYLDEAMAKKGVLSTRQPSEQETADLAFGLHLAKEIGAADIGQTVVVKDQIPLAIEAIEGTDACIARGGKLGRSGAVVVKVLKPGQDQRFDLPVIGPRTLVSLKKAGCTALGIEAGHVLLIDEPEVLRLAAKWKIALVGI